MYSVYQHWDPLKVCIVGRSYSPKFYDYIKNPKVRKVFYQIAEETEEDYQKFITLLESFGVTVLRPDVSDNYTDYIQGELVLPPPMTPRDDTAMIGNNFYIDARDLRNSWKELAGADWPKCPENFNDIPEWIINECRNDYDLIWTREDFSYNNIIRHMKQHSNVIMNKNINTAMTSRIGQDLYFGTMENNDDLIEIKKNAQSMFPEYRCHVIETQGHSDGCYCPVVPGLIVSLADMPIYEKTFPGWEVVHLPNQSWSKVEPFLELKQKNAGKWWVPGQELNEDFTNFVEEWMNHWVGYVEETVFDVNMLVIDEKNVVCNGYNEKVFDAFSRYGITPHVINFRHRYFWDGGLHCITSDVHRDGTINDYFPERA
jgi:hypothetical protein